MKRTYEVPEHVVILGAGPGGLAVGHEFTDKGGKVTVLEQNSFIGGLCRTIENQGYKFDLGGHRWFTKNEDLNRWFRRLMEGEIVMVERTSRIYHGGVFFSYPISFGDIVRKTNPFTVLHAGVSFMVSSLRQAMWRRPIENMRDAYTAQFGAKLYEMFFRQYSEKVWGLPCEKLSADWVAQRSKGLSIWSLVRNAMFNPQRKYVSLIEEFMYPRDGYVRIPERMAEDIEARGSTVLTDSPVTGIRYHGTNDFEVFYGSGEDRRSVRGNAVVSSIPLGVLARIIEPGAGEDVMTAAKALSFRDLVTVNLRLKKQQVTVDTWLYIQDKDILFGRMHEPKNWSRAMVPDDEHTSLVLECFCSRGDNIWSMTDEAIADRCIDDLADKLNFVSRNEVVGWQIVRTVHCYPVYDLQYHENTAKVRKYLDQFEGLFIVGRGGTFRYNNADHSIEMGLLLGRRLLGYDVDYMMVNTESEYHEEIRSDSIDRDHYVAADEVHEERRAVG
ncbi:MAG: FAD-dependent oxidoreductase [Alphaproteobacteria bacterium]